MKANSPSRLPMSSSRTRVLSAVAPSLTLMALLFFAAAATAEAGIKQESDEHGFRAEFPSPTPIRLYRVQFQDAVIKDEGFAGWTYALPVYGDDVFLVACNELGVGKLKGLSDLEIIRTLYSSVDGIEQLEPKKRKVGIAKSDGYELTINFQNGRRVRLVCCRIGDKFYRICASCIDSQPGLPPDPFTADFVMSDQVEKFFDSFELLKK